MILIRVFFHISILSPLRLSPALDTLQKGRPHNKIQLERARVSREYYEEEQKPKPLPKEFVLALKDVVTGERVGITYTVRRLTDTDSARCPFQPQINEKGDVLWNTRSCIFLYGGKDIKSLGKGFHYLHNVRMNNKGQVVWAGKKMHLGDDEIFFYDGRKVRQLTNNKHSDGSPSINDHGEVVWSGFDGKDVEIFLYDGSNIIQLTDDTDCHNNPEINNRGEVVWEMNSKREDSEIFFYDGQGVEVLTNNSVYDYSPQINDQGKVVWFSRVGTEGRDRDDEILIYDGKDVVWLTDNKRRERNVQINNRGQAVWEEHDGHDWEIFFDNGKTVIQLTDNDIDDVTPQINDEGEIVWCGAGRALQCGRKIERQIFFYNGKVVMQLTEEAEDVYDNVHPHINNRGNIVWSGDYGSGYDIFLATKNLDLFESAFPGDEDKIKATDIIGRKLPL
ncbi:MAG: hypothetical protein KAJ66_03300 [Candidatus Omnitrophica bacterium]|nr:hypothetical protein [Candidatus Omnitrophota bacterium]